MYYGTVSPHIIQTLYYESQHRERRSPESFLPPTFADATVALAKRKRKPAEFTQENFWRAGQIRLCARCRERLVLRADCKLQTVPAPGPIPRHTAECIYNPKPQSPPPPSRPDTHTALSAGSHLSAFSVFASRQPDRVSVTPSRCRKQ